MSTLLTLDEPDAPPPTRGADSILSLLVEAAAALNQGRVAGLAQALAVGNGAAVLPDDGGRQGAACGALPQHGGFTLVGDADGGHLTGGDACSNQGLAGAVELCLPDLQWVVLHPAGGRVGLVEFLLGGGQDVAPVIEDEGPAAARTLVEGEEVGHGQASGRWCADDTAARPESLAAAAFGASGEAETVAAQAGGLDADHQGQGAG